MNGKPDTAIILAAGEGNRIQAGRERLSKPLLRVGGLYLIERVLLTLHAAGISKFRIVVGANKDKLIEGIERMPSLKSLAIEYVDCPDYALGNGVSFSAGAKGVKQSFVLSMSDHIFGKETIGRFLAACAERPERAYLATDPAVNSVFDLDDATKVKIDTDGRITQIGKSIPTVDQIDMGLFYFPAGSDRQIAAARSTGATSVSDIVQAINRAQGFFTAPLKEALWQDVDTPAMAKEAERRLMRSLTKKTDGLVSRYCNRFFSKAVTRWLVRWNISPNTVTTVVFLLGLLCCFLVISADPVSILAAGLLFQIASILDGCDGEISRLTFKGSDFGAWYDTITDNIRYALFVFCCGIGAYRSSHSPIDLWLLAFFPFITVYFSSLMNRHTGKRNRPRTNLVVTAAVEDVARRSNRIWDRLIIPLRPLVKQDVSAAIISLFVILNLRDVIFRIACLAAAVMTISAYRALQQQESTEERLLEKKYNRTFLFYTLGALVLGFLVSRMGFHEIAGALETIGAKIFLIFTVAFFWHLANGLSLKALVGARIGIWDLTYNQIVGEALNTVLPLAGLGGEPYKVSHLAKWLPMGEASRLVVINKLAHAMAGPLFGAAAGFGTLLLVDLAQPYYYAILACSVLFTIGSLLLAWITLSTAPSKATSYILAKLKISFDFKPNPGETGRIFWSLGYRLVGRIVGLLEAYLIFVMLKIPPDLGALLAVQAFVTASGVWLFVVPQGLGVNEAGVAGAFQMMNLDPHLGLAFGILRRARIVFWAVLGLGLQLISGITRLRFFRAPVSELP